MYFKQVVGENETFLKQEPTIKRYMAQTAKAVKSFVVVDVAIFLAPLVSLISKMTPAINDVFAFFFIFFSFIFS